MSIFFSDISCNDYNLLNDPTRNLRHGIDANGFCDTDWNSSPDWQGPGWYRMSLISGTTIPEEPVEPFHCNTQAPGWLNGKHPEPGNTTDGTVCFNSAGNTCKWQTQIKIKNCNDYFLYHLPEPPTCRLRYCTSNSIFLGRYMY